MKIKYTTSDGRFSTECEGDVKDIWEQIASFQEVFCENKCGKCKKVGFVKFTVRDSEDDSGEKFKYHELVCTACGAKKGFGLNRDGKTLFPKTSVKKKEKVLFDTFKKSDDDKVAYLPDSGWLKWDKEKGVNY